MSRYHWKSKAQQGFDGYSSDEVHYDKIERTRFFPKSDTEALWSAVRRIGPAWNHLAGDLLLMQQLDIKDNKEVVKIRGTSQSSWTQTPSQEG